MHIGNLREKIDADFAVAFMTVNQEECILYTVGLN